MLRKRFTAETQRVCVLFVVGLQQKKLFFLNLSIDIFCQLTLLQERFAYLEPQLCACAAHGVSLPASQV